YPHDFKSKKRGGGPGNGATYNVFGDYKNGADSQRVEGLNVECKTGHGHSTIVPTRGYVPAGGSQNAIGETSNTQRGSNNVNYTGGMFSREQYEQILNLLNQGSASSQGSGIIKPSTNANVA
ncbi:hypothetical protein HAX54_006692, partial [Datura stramonium]|nr:hypothetical protein [Datura stramonium]